MKNSYFEKLKDPRWQKKRLKIFQRDDFACQGCKSTEKTLHVHHVHYAKGEPWDTPDEFLMTLCEDCHESRGSLESDAKLMLAQILSRLPHDPGNEEDLEYFVRSLANEVSSDDDSFSPMVVNGHEFEYLTDIRWFQYACDHPEFREGYEAIVGRVPSWAGIDVRKAELEEKPTDRAR